MKLKYFFQVLLVTCSVFINAQNSLRSGSISTSSLEKVINSHRDLPPDLEQVKILLEPLKLRNSDVDLIVYDAILANAYAKKFDKINEKSNYLYLKSIKEAKKQNHRDLELWATVNYAEYLYNFRQITTALPVFMSAAEMIDRIEPTKILFPAQSYTKIGFYLGTIGDDSESIKYLKKALSYSQPASSDHALILDNLGMAYLRTGDLVNAEKNITLASNISKEIGDEIRYAKTLGNLAQIKEKNRDYKGAMQLLKEDIAISEQSDSDMNTMYAYTVLARVLIAYSKFSEANNYLKKAQEIAQKKSYFKINELAILKLKLQILNHDHQSADELIVRRRISALEDSLNKTDGVLPLNQANWMVHKRKYQQSIIENEKKLRSESNWKKGVSGLAGFLIVFSLLIFVDLNRREKKVQIENERKFAEYENARLLTEKKLLEANRTLEAQIIFLKDKNVQIQKLKTEINDRQESQLDNGRSDTGRLDELLQTHLMTEENWQNFRREFRREHSTFYDNIQESFPEITESNLRIILLQKLGFTNAEISGLLGITIEAVKKSKQRLKHKLGEKYGILFQLLVAKD